MILFIFGSSKILLFPQNALPSSPAEISLKFPRRHFTRFSSFPFPLYLKLSSLSLSHDIHCLVDFSFFSKQSKCSVFLREERPLPGLFPLLLPEGWSLLSYLTRYSQPTYGRVKVLSYKRISLISVSPKGFKMQRCMCHPRWRNSQVCVCDGTFSLYKI